MSTEEFLSLLRAAVEAFNASGDGDRLAGTITDLSDEYERKALA